MPKEKIEIELLKEILHAIHDQKQEHELLREILHAIHSQTKETQQIMSVLSDLQAAVAAVQLSTANQNSAVLAAIADIQSIPASDAQLVPLTSALTAAAVQIQANADALNKAVGVITGPPESVTLDTIPPSVSAPLSAGPVTVQLTGISSTATSPTISVTATASDGGAIIAAPVVSYTSPAETGSLTITPVAIGSSNVTVTVSDGIGSTAQTFAVAVS